MESELSRKFKAWALLSSRFIWRRKGLWLRAILCWLIGLLFIFADSEHDYDLRLKIRGEQAADPEIVLLYLSPPEWQNWLGSRPEDSLSRDTTYITDSYYWNPTGWEKILTRILNERPLAIGVSTYFGENINSLDSDDINKKTFSDPRIVWATQLDDEGRILPSRFAKKFSRNSGLNEYSPDRDGVIRRFNYTSESTPHFASQLARRSRAMKSYDWKQFSKEAPVINFRGGKKPLRRLNYQICLIQIFRHIS